jgi:hypothetical protein
MNDQSMWLRGIRRVGTRRWGKSSLERENMTYLTVVECDDDTDATSDAPRYQKKNSSVFV